MERRNLGKGVKGQMHMSVYDVEGPIALRNLKTGSYPLWSDSEMKYLGEHVNLNGVTLFSGESYSKRWNGSPGRSINWR